MCSETHPQNLQPGGTWSEGGQHGCSVQDLLCSFRLCARPRRKCLFRASVRTEARCGAAVTRPALARGVCFQRFIYGPDNGCPLCWAPAGSRRRTSKHSHTASNSGFAGHNNRASSASSKEPPRGSRAGPRAGRLAHAVLGRPQREVTSPHPLHSHWLPGIQA